MSASHNSADIIIPVSNQYSHTRTLLEGIYRHTDLPFHIYIIDNDSTDETVDLHKIYARNITILRNRMNRKWRGGINQGIQLGNNPNIVFMNNDVEVSKGWLNNMIAFLDTHPRIGAVGPLTSGPNDWQNIDKVRERYATQIPHFKTNDLHERNRILNFHFHRSGILIEGMLSLSCVVLKRRTVNALGMLNETMPGRNDDEYCRRLRKSGYVLGLALDTYVICDSDPAAETANSDLKRRNSSKKNVVSIQEKQSQYL
jgi:O-antigen biosynthesis protein